MRDRETIEVIESRSGNVLVRIVLIFVLGLVGVFAYHSNFGKNNDWIGFVFPIAILIVYCFRSPQKSEFKMSILSSIASASFFILFISIIFLIAWIGWLIISGSMKNDGLQSLRSDDFFGYIILWSIFLLVLMFVQYRIYTSLNNIPFINFPRFTFDNNRNEIPNSQKAQSNYEKQGQGGYQNDRDAEFGPAQKIYEENWWDVLEIPKNSSIDDVNDAAKKLLKQYHPDKHSLLPARLRSDADRHTKAINKAREDAKLHFKR